MTDARTLTFSLKGRWYRSYGSAPCPVCQPEGRKDQNALTLSDGRTGRLMLHCKKAGCTFGDILAAAGIGEGDYRPPDLREIARHKARERAEAVKKALQAQRCWQDALPIAGTLAETYLRGRDITCALPETLRFHPACWHGPSATKASALVALVQGGDGFAVHRTYLRADGTDKAALDPVKMMLGAISGGAVRLSGGSPHLLVGEGVESTLSLLCGLLLSPVPSRLTIAQDGDTPGRTAAHSLAQRAHAAGWTVDILDPGNGADFNDVLTGKAVPA